MFMQTSPLPSHHSPSGPAVSVLVVIAGAELELQMSFCHHEQFSGNYDQVCFWEDVAHIDRHLYLHLSKMCPIVLENQ